MKKVTLVVMDREREAALTALRRLGVMHLEKREVSSERLSDLLERKGRLDAAYGLLRNYPWPKNAMAQSLESGETASAFAGSILALAERKKNLFDALSADIKEESRIAPWGDLDPDSLREIQAAGIELVPFELPLKKYAEARNAARLVEVSRSKGTVRAFAIGAPLEASGSAKIDGETPWVPGERSLAAVRQSIADAKGELAQIEGRFSELSLKRENLLPEIKRLESEIEFETARVGMDATSDGPGNLNVAWFSGFVPAEDSGIVKRAAVEQGWAIVVAEPAGDELPPTKVKNSALVRIIQPVFNFLGTVPNYREYDISAWFLLFFSFFFAMIFGDGGYGSILFLMGLALAVKSKAAGKPVPDMVKLIMTLSVFTILWGVVTMSWFGISPDVLPKFFHAIDIWWLSNANPDSGDNVKVLCFFMGTVQLVIAHFKNIKRDIGSLKVLAQVGQLAMVVGMVSLVLNLVISSTRFPIPPYALPLILGGFILNFVFANYEKGGNPFIAMIRSTLASMTNIVSVFLGVVNVFADIVSYIRLWAVGLAGVAISQTVNSMAGPLLGKLSLFLVGVLILGFGHGLNILMSVLSVIVHGVRLNVLEFSSHLGMEWSGFSYDPFRERIETIETLSKEQS